MNLNTEEQEELDLALAISLSEQDRKSCSQSDAFLTSNEIHTNKILSGNQADPTRFPQIGRIVDPDLRPYNDIRARDDLRDRHDRTTGRLNQLPYGSSSSDLLTDSRVSLNTQMTQSIPASDNDSSRTLQNLPHRLAKQLYGDISQNFIDPYACAGCRRLILGTYLNADGSRYHPECFTCAGCNGQLLGSHFPKGNPPLPYHKECAEELFNPRCCLCDAVLKGQYLRHSFFEEEVYCVTHVGSRQCFACSRKEPSSLGGCKREGFTELHDGRVSCMECISTAIVDSQEALPLYLEAVDFMERVLGLRIPLGMRDIPVLAVDLPSLDEQQTSTKTGHTGSESVTRGLTLIKIGQVRHISSGGIQPSRSGYFTVAAPQVYHIEEIREVTAVLVLFGLPRDLTASILAHEAMHVWMKLTKSIPYPLPMKVEEGLCQVIANRYLLNLTTDTSSAVLESQGKSTSTEASRWSNKGRVTHFSKALGSLEYCSVISATSTSTTSSSDKMRAYFSHQIETNCSEVYGEGFREAQRCCSVLGLEIVLEVVTESSNLPQL